MKLFSFQLLRFWFNFFQNHVLHYNLVFFAFPLHNYSNDIIHWKSKTCYVKIFRFCTCIGRKVKFLHKIEMILFAGIYYRVVKLELTLRLKRVTRNSFVKSLPSRHIHADHYQNWPNFRSCFAHNGTFLRILILPTISLHSRNLLAAGSVSSVLCCV